jgi:mRNA-degrading endonuclease HigB of HigAB toxin-antitoxin module
MRIIGRDKLMSCIQSNIESQSAFVSWLREVEKSHWKQRMDVEQDFPLAEWSSEYHSQFILCNRRFGINALLSYDTQILLVQRVNKLPQLQDF